MPPAKTHLKLPPQQQRAMAKANSAAVGSNPSTPSDPKSIGSRSQPVVCCSVPVEGPPDTEDRSTTG
jgi:hypothetical protein